MAIEKVAVIGGGLMGSGIAQVAAMSGQEVSLIDVSDELLAKGIGKIRESLTKFFEKGKIRESPESVVKRIRTATNLAKAVSDADLVIEAVPEEIGLKKKIFSELDMHAPNRAILATNTSGLSITAISEATKRKERVIGMHWMNPPQIMRLIEVIKGKYTDEKTLQSTLDLCRKYGKEYIIAQKDIWFFLSARAQRGWVIEANLAYLRKEADVAEIDAVAKYRIGLPMGEFELADFTGAMDIRSKGLASTDAILKSYPEFEPWPVFLEAMRYVSKELWGPMTEKGLSGVKTGRGFYKYPEGKYVKPEIPAELAERLEPIRFLAPAINVAAWCVSNGVGSVADINKSFKLAFGWPKGIFEFLDEYGLNSIISVLKEKEEKAPDWLKDIYKVDPLLSSWGS